MLKINPQTGAPWNPGPHFKPFTPNVPMHLTDAEVDHIRAERASLDERIAALEAAPKLWPQVGDVYWSMTATAEVTDMTWNDDEYDAGRKSIGNVFRTQCEAELERDRLKVTAIMREMADGGKWVIRRMLETSVLGFTASDMHSLNEPTFRTIVSAQACLDRLRAEFPNLLELWGGE